MNHDFMDRSIYLKCHYLLEILLNNCKLGQYFYC